MMDFGKDKISSLFGKLFIPTLCGMLSMCAVTAVDGIFVGHGIGSDAIAAINICIPLLMVFTGLGLMTGIGSSVIASIALSRGKIKSARLNVTQSLLFTSALVIVLSALMLTFPERTAYLLGSSDHLLPYVKEYLIWFVPSLTFQMWLTVSLFIIRLDGSPKLAMWCNLLAAVVNTFLGWLFIFPLQMGMTGTALAATIGIALGGSIALIYLWRYAKTLKLYPVHIGMRGFHIFARNILSQCRIGSSALLGETTMAVLMFIGNHVFMRYLGDNGVGAFGICCYYMPFVFMIGNAIAQSAQPVISYNFGIRQTPRVRETEKTAVATALAFGITVSAVFFLFPQHLVALFLNPENPAAHLAVSGFPHFASGFVFFIFNLTAIGYFQSVEKIRPATVFALLRGFVFLIPSFIFLPCLIGENGIWLAMPLSESATSLIIVLLYLLRRKK